MSEQVEALRERLQQAECSRDELAQRSKRLERENRQLRARVEAVERSIAAMTGGRGGPESPQVDVFPAPQFFPNFPDLKLGNSYPPQLGKQLGTGTRSIP